jgi:hypothetical protein
MFIKQLWNRFMRAIGAQRTWSILNGTPVAYDDDGNPYFDFPSYSPGVNYLRTPVKGVLGPITVHFQITGLDPVFDFRTNPDNTGLAPSSVRIMIQRKGDQMTEFQEFHRFWSRPAFRKLEPGSFTLIATLEPSNWSSVFGKTGDQAQNEFWATLQDAEYLCLTFGGGSFFGHSVFVPQGNARFTVKGVVV